MGQTKCLCPGQSCIGLKLLLFYTLVSYLHSVSGNANGSKKLTCKSNLSGSNYQGTVSSTRSGRQCQRWDVQTPHAHSVTPSMLPDETLAEAANFCRSPDFDPGGPWCFTTDPDVEWEYCDVPQCATAGCRDVETGINYIGGVNKTVSGEPCLRWADVVIFIQYGYTNYPKIAFPDGDREHSSCRNPLGAREQPWCHVALEDEGEVDLEDSWQFCDVPLCLRQDNGSSQPIIRNKACQLAGGTCMQEACCPMNNYTTKLCSDKGTVCCLDKANCDWRKEQQYISQWPQGSYGLLMSIFGCPENDGFEWFTGTMSIGRGSMQRLGNRTSELHHIRMDLTEQLRLTLCHRDEQFAGSNRAWPAGNYCIFQFGKGCPLGFDSFWMMISDESGKHTVSFEIDTSCDLDPTKLCLKVCCRNDSDVNIPIDLPPRQAFYLLQNGPACQEVSSMEAKPERLHIRLGEDFKVNKSLSPESVTEVADGIVLNLCYYEMNVLRGCYDPVDGGFFFRGKVNMTTSGACSNWEDIEMVSQYKQYDYVGLDNNNYCRNTVIFEFEDQPWCYANGQKVLCGIPKCADSAWADYQQVGRGRPARQAVGTLAEAQLVNDGLIDTCSKQSFTHAWWQVDLQGWYDIIGVRLYRLKVDACVIRLANLFVGWRPDDFQQSGSLYCARNVSIGASEDPVVPCRQPVRGRYLTLENLAYIDYESGMKPYEHCLDLCEVVAYVKDSNCGRRLLERTRGNEIQPIWTSSDGDVQDARTYILENEMVWCGGMSSSSQWIKVELLYPRRIQGVMTQGSLDEDDMVTNFNLLFGLTENSMLYYEDYPGVPKNFTTDPLIKTPQLHTLMTEVTARIVKLEVRGFNGRPCLRFDIIGCVTNFKNLIQKDEAQQSSEILGRQASFATDGDIMTCSETTLEETAWWMTDLSSPRGDLNLHSVVLKTGIAFPWNLAVRRPPLAISYGWDGFPWRANDGDRNPDFWGGSCCHTFNHDYPWWAVELDRESVVTSVHITNRGDCCETRLNKLIIYVGSVRPVEDTIVNASLYNVCNVHDAYFTPGETRTFDCFEPLRGKYVIIVVNNKEHYLTICEVEVYGDRVPFLVGVAADAPPVGGVESDVACQLTSPVPTSGLVHSYSCPLNVGGRYLLTQAGGPGPISLCDIVAFGGSRAIIRTIPQSELLHAVCAEPLRLHIELNSDQELMNLSPWVSNSKLPLLIHLCEGKIDCIFPVATDQQERKDSTPVMFFCSELVEPASVCRKNISTETSLQTPNFPFYYGLDLECKWLITAPTGLYVALNITWLQILGKVDPYRDGCVEINPGNCADIALVTYGRTNQDGSSPLTGSLSERGLSATQPSLYVSSSGSMTVSFRSCYRNLGLSGDWARKLGLQANIEFQGCQGCHVQSSATLLQCTGSCGQIVSRGFPYSYNARERTLWTISVQAGYYVTLTFLDFDIYEVPLSDCLKDVVEVLDVDLIGGQTTLGKYCNSVRPPKLLKSSWSQLVVSFASDMEISGRGFHALYQQEEYQLSPDFPPNGPDPGCPANWTMFMNNCYTLVTWNAPLTWQESEVECRKSGGHLASINSRQEMIFVHYKLTTEWRTQYFRTFIGLNDHEAEGKYRWIDGSPVTYTDWALSSNYDNVHQPDGADVEDCVMIRLDSVHDTRSWHDIPCAYDKVQQFLCEVPSSAQSELEKGVASITLPLGIMLPRDDTFRCNNGEYVLSQFRCDGMDDCHDNSDEMGCQAEGCSESHFQCKDSTCISITYYCDFKPHCPDGSDEESCVKRPCTDEEFMCMNGQCISMEKRCDLLEDCQDGSDESNCDRCALDVAFQCFDGSCIPRGKRCDSVVDCPGSLYEDESADCSREIAESSCLDWKVAGSIYSGRYRIQPPGVGGFEVECDMTTYEDYVLTTIHHDVERRVYVSGFSKPGDYVQQLDYKLTTEQLEAVVSTSVHCEQFVRVDCFASSGLGNDFWLNRDGEIRTWTTSTNSNCSCLLTSSCDGENKKCMCQKADILVPRVMTTDEGFITSQDDLPMTAISLSGTGFAGTQIQYHYIGPLVCYQYANKSRDDLRCRTGQWIPRNQQCLATGDRYGDPAGCRDMSHLQDCETHSCPADFLKCSEGHCLPLQSVCDKIWDCVNGEDEVGCQNFTCPGHFRCLNENICITLEQRCDGIKHCREGNDEWHCDVKCPQECACIGLAYTCLNQSLASFPKDLSLQARRIDFARNRLSLERDPFTGFTSLAELILSFNNISVLPVGVFMPLVNLYMLDLSYNNIEFINSHTFQGLANLRVLQIFGNDNLFRVDSFAFAGLDQVSMLDLRGLSITEVEPKAFANVTSLIELDLSQNDLKHFSDGLLGLDHLHSLNVSLNPDLIISRKAFTNLRSLQYLQSDYFKYCCFVKEKVPEERCLPVRDEFSSCEDLMRRDLLKVFLWVLGLMAFLCNIFVLIYRRSEKLTVYSYCVMNLAVADFFMGFYMVVLASVDAYYRGVYIEFAEVWTSSWACQFLGFLNTFSSETSVFTLCVISADRFYKIVFPLHASKFDLRKAKMLMCCVWLLGFLLAALPLLPISYFGNGNFYGRSSVCISIYLTNERTPGWQFSISLFHGVNFMAFMFIFIAYAYLFHVVKKGNKKTKTFTHAQKPNQNDVALARRLTLVVFTDFICWVPINMMGLAAGIGVAIPGEVYAWVVVFLLPINSAINPLLYTISSIRLKAKEAKAKEASSQGTSVSSLLVYFSDPETKDIDIKTYVNQSSTVSLRMLMNLAKATAIALKEAHDKGYSSSGLEPNSVFIRTDTKSGMQVGFSVSVDEDIGRHDDIFAFGKLISYLLRRFTAAQKT